MPQPDNTPPKRKAGRPKGSVGQVAEARKMTVREYAMTYVFEALDVWAEIMKDNKQNGSARAAAAAHIVNRAIGQPAQAQPNEGDTPDQPLQAIRREIVDPAAVAKKVKVDAK